MNQVLAASAGETAGAIIAVAVMLAFFVAVLVAMWRIFTKAGEPGWAALIPFYNFYVLLKIVGRPWWWLLLYFIPIVGFIVALIVLYDLSQSFGKGVGFTIGLIFLPPIFLLILGLGDAVYLGPAGPERPNVPQAPPGTGYPPAAPTA